MRISLLAFCAAALAASPARADKVKPMKAQFLCGTFVDGKIKQPITGGKVGKMTDPIACAIHADDPKEPSHMGHVHTVRHGKPEVTTSGKTDDFGPGTEKPDFEIVMKPDVPDENKEIAFAACEDFDIVATVSDDLGVYFKKTIKVQQSCPKPPPPKPIAATLSCFYEAEDGTGYRWPGNGVKAKPRLSSARELDCSIANPKDLPDGTTLKGTLTIKQTKVTKVTEAGPRPPSGWSTEFAFGMGEFNECETLDLAASLEDQNKVKRWSGTLKIVQRCDD